MTETSTLTIPVFYACTAATPDGPPLEIAWGSLAFETYGVICGSRLIRPPAAWTSELARDTLRRTALRAYLCPDLRIRHAAPRNRHAHERGARQRELFSAVPEDDARLRRIFDAAKMRRIRAANKPTPTS